MDSHFDLMIAGGGLVGNCLALALKDSGLNIAVIEAASRQQQQQSPAGDRALALAAGTVQLLQSLGAWEGVAQQATAIKQIHVSDRGHFGKTRLSAQQQGVEALGYVITAREIETHVADLVAQTQIQYFYQTRVAGLISDDAQINVHLKQDNGESLNLTAALLVGADGGQSSVRQLLQIDQQQTEYGQTALVTTVESSLPHNNTAYERFTAFGPLAFLPVTGKRTAVVWTRSHEQAESLMAGGEADFLAELQACFGYRLGTLKLAAPRRAFPLSLIRAEKMVAERAVIIGNAVHQLHPVAGQGFNLSIRDVAELAEALIKQHQNQADIGEAGFLNHYAKQRQQDHNQTIGFTDNVVRIFSNQWLALAALRNTGLTLLDHLPFAKQLLAKHAMGLARRLPNLGG
ncbi:MAG: 2-octaprenyl-6-methoxyphenyl hydroxylase [Methylomonas sp.]